MLKWKNNLVKQGNQPHPCAEVHTTATQSICGKALKLSYGYSCSDIHGTSLSKCVNHFDYV